MAARGVAAAFGGGVYIADTSAWQRAALEPVADEWRDAVAAGQIVTTPIVRMELLYATRTSDEFDDFDRLLRQLREVPIKRSVTDAAIAAMTELATRWPLSHRVPVPDLLVAAAAQDVAIGVIHYDHHYDRLADVMSFESRWIAPPGTLT